MKLAAATIYWNNRQGLQRLLKSIPTTDVLDYFIAVDGMFAFYSTPKYTRHRIDLSDPSHTPNYNSLDGSTELLQSHFKDTNTKLILEPTRQPMTQVQKRNRYLEICDKQQVDITHLIIVDSDEFFHYPKDAQGNTEKQKEYWTQFKDSFEHLTTLDNEHNVYSIKCIYADQKPALVMDRPRCWYKPGQMRYIRNSHYHYANIYTEQAKINYTPSYARTRMYCQAPKQTIPTQLMLVHDPNILTTKQQKLRQLYKKYSHIYEQQILTGKTHKEADLIARKGNRLNQ